MNGMGCLKKLLLFLLFIFFNSCFIFSHEFKTEKNALKTTFLSYATGSVKLSYERLLTTIQSIEITGGVIGVGADRMKNHPHGGLFRCAHKINLNNDFGYSFNGIYYKSEFALSSFGYDFVSENTVADETLRKNSTMGSLMGCLGYQWGKKFFVFDGYIGIGGALGTECDTYYQHGFVLWDFFNTKNKYISLTFGMKLGFVF
jgi:hypothetical protein